MFKSNFAPHVCVTAGSRVRSIFRYLSGIVVTWLNRPLMGLPATRSRCLTRRSSIQPSTPARIFTNFPATAGSRNNPLPKDETSYARYTELANDNREKLRMILESTSANTPGRSANEQKIGDEYASCMDAAAINAKGLKPFQPQLDLIAAAKSKKELAPLIANLHLNGVNVFFRTRSDQDFANSTRVIAFFAAGGLGLPERDFYTRTDPKSVEQRNQYVQHVTNTFKLMGESPPKPRAMRNPFSRLKPDWQRLRSPSRNGAIRKTSITP